jgi:hypothetical protein
MGERAAQLASGLTPPRGGGDTLAMGGTGLRRRSRALWRQAVSRSGRAVPERRVLWACLLCLPVLASLIGASGASAVGNRLSARGADATGCLGSALPKPAVAVLTDRQAISALHQHVTFAGETGGSSTPECQWNGNPLPPNQVGPYSQYQVQLWLNLHAPFVSGSAARSYYEPLTTAFGTPTRVPDLGTAAVFVPG